MYKYFQHTCTFRWPWDFIRHNSLLSDSRSLQYTIHNVLQSTCNQAISTLHAHKISRSLLAIKLYQLSTHTKYLAVYLQLSYINYPRTHKFHRPCSSFFMIIKREYKHSGTFSDDTVMFDVLQNLILINFAPFSNIYKLSTKIPRL